MLSKGSSALSHASHLGGGEIIITLSPRTIRMSSFLGFSGSVVSSVSSSTRFRCWSNPFSFPRRLFPPLKRTSTVFPRLSWRIWVVISLIFNPLVNVCLLLGESINHLNVSIYELTASTCVFCPVHHTYTRTQFSLASTP